MTERRCKHCDAVTVKPHGRSLLEFKSESSTYWDPEKAQVSGRCKSCGRKWAEVIEDAIPTNPLTSLLALA